MGGGASTSKNADSRAIFESRAKAKSLEEELDKINKEKEEMQETIQQRNHKVFSLKGLGELNRTLQRANENMEKEQASMKADVTSAETSLAELRSEVEQIKSKAAKSESEARELKGELIAEKEDHNNAREEIDRVGQLVSQAIVEKEAIEKQVAAVEEEKDMLDQMLRAATESADTYKELSAKLMHKKKPVDAEQHQPGSQQSKEQKDNEPGKQASQEQVTTNLLAGITPKRAARLKICIISTFEDFFMEREMLERDTFKPLQVWCEKRNIVLEVVDPWSGLLAEQVHGFNGLYVPWVYMDEIEDADVAVVLLGERYGQDLPEDLLAPEATVRAWLNRHHTQNRRYGSVLELASVYAAFFCGHDSSLPASILPARVLSYVRDPSYIEGLPEAMTRHFRVEGSRAAGKLDDLKQRLRRAGLVREEGYADPHMLAGLLRDDLLAVAGKSFAAPLSVLQVSSLAHEEYQEGHAWVGQGGKGAPLPEEVEKHLERIRKFVVNDVQQPLVVVGEFGSGRTSLLRAAVVQLRKRFPPPDTLIIPHFAGCNADARDAAVWVHRVCRTLQEQLMLQLVIPSRPQDLVRDFPLWLEAAAATGVKVFLFVDGVDHMSLAGAVQEDPVAFLPKSFPLGVRVVLSTGAGTALTSLAQRGCGAITVWPIDEKARQTLIDGYLTRTKKPFDKKGPAKLVKSDRTANPQFLLDTLVEIDSIGVLDGTATMEPMLYYLEAENLHTLTEKAIYRWESAYNGKIIGGSLVRDVLTCIWASRFGLRRSELGEMLGLKQMQLSPLLRRCAHFLSTCSGLITFKSNSLREAVKRRYLPTPDAEAAAHDFMSTYFEDPASGPIARRVDELPWQVSQGGDSELLSKTITKAAVFVELWDGERRQDLWSYVGVLEAKDAHQNLGHHCKTSILAYDNSEPKAEAEDVALLSHKMGVFLAEVGFMEVASQLLLKAMDAWSAIMEEDDGRTAATAEALAKVLSNMRSTNAEKFFERAVQIRQRLGKSAGPSLDFAVLCNDYGLYQKRQGKHAEAVRLFMRAVDIWSRHHGPEHLTVANASLNLCTACYAMGHLGQAKEHAKTAMDIRKAAVGDNHPLYAEALVNLAAIGLASEQQGRTKKEAERQLLLGVAILERTRGGQHQDTQWAKSFLPKDEPEELDDDDDDDDADEDEVELQVFPGSAE